MLQAVWAVCLNKKCLEALKRSDVIEILKKFADDKEDLDLIRDVYGVIFMFTR